MKLRYAIALGFLLSAQAIGAKDYTLKKDFDGLTAGQQVTDTALINYFATGAGKDVKSILLRDEIGGLITSTTDVGLIVRDIQQKRPRRRVGQPSFSGGGSSTPASGASGSGSQKSRGRIDMSKFGNIGSVLGGRGTSAKPKPSSTGSAAAVPVSTGPAPSKAEFDAEKAKLARDIATANPTANYRKVRELAAAAAIGGKTLSKDQASVLVKAIMEAKESAGGAVGSSVSRDFTTLTEAQKKAIKEKMEKDGDGNLVKFIALLTMRGIPLTVVKQKVELGGGNFDKFMSYFGAAPAGGSSTVVAPPPPPPVHVPPVHGGPVPPPAGTAATGGSSPLHGGGGGSGVVVGSVKDLLLKACEAASMFNIPPVHGGPVPAPAGAAPAGDSVDGVSMEDLEDLAEGYKQVKGLAGPMGGMQKELVVRNIKNRLKGKPAAIAKVYELAGGK